MAVVKMEFLQLIGHLDDLDEVARKIVLSSSVQITDAFYELQHIEKTNADSPADGSSGLRTFRQFRARNKLDEVQKKIDDLMNIFALTKEVAEEFLVGPYQFDSVADRIDQFYGQVAEQHAWLGELRKKQEELADVFRQLSLIKDWRVDLAALANMQYFTVRVGKLPRYNMDKLTKNYENISAIVFKLFQGEEETGVLLFIPRPMEPEVNQVLASLEYADYPLNFSGTPAECLARLDEQRKKIERETAKIHGFLADFKQKHRTELAELYARVVMEIKVAEIKSQIACTEHFFYLTGWIPRSEKKKLLRLLRDYEDRLVVMCKNTREVRQGLVPPTYIRNGYLLRPFESVVRLYGVPSYNELDPTAFVGLSYMFLFGAMFGDVGQGLVLFLIGEYLSRCKSRPYFGGVIARLGLSSVLFGFLYGSVFGFEDVLKTYVVKPMASINFMLVAAVIVGVILLTVAFLYNLVNSLKNRDWENGVFGRNGFTGMLFYWLLLYLLISAISGTQTVVPEWILFLLLLTLLAVMVLKEPAANLLKGVRPLHHESRADYYIEGGFGAVETLLSLFSNTLSFIRVGAFAINHVGLFIAFDTLAKMMSSQIASDLMLVLGNMVIIGLEGLIVFIQGLRLEYYELFGKYFSGMGYQFTPNCIENLIRQEPLRKRAFWPVGRQVPSNQ